MIWPSSSISRRPGQLPDLGHRVDDADRHVGERLLDGRRRLAAVRLPVLAVDLLDEDRLGRRDCRSRWRG